MCEQDGFASIYVPKGYRYGYRLGTGESLEKKRGTIPSFARNMNEPIVFQDIARYRFW